MNILYKYYSDLKLSYFDNPTLKLSQPKNLNDPFESAVQLDMLRSNISLRQVLKTIPVVGKDEYTIDTIMLTQLVKEIASYGIVSLSETHRNLLMWAHYANEHRGLCIGYHTEASDALNSNSELTNRLKLTSHKINYDSSRYDPVDDNFNIEENKLWINKVVRKLLTTKSDEWIYEKEHRIIHPIYHCDYFTSEKTLNHNDYTRDIYHVHRPTKMTTYSNGLKEYTLNKTWDGMNEYFYWLQNNNNLNFFKRIPPTQIKSIFLGYRYPTTKKNDLLNKAHAINSKIKDAKIYQMTLCSHEFKLKPIEIYPSNQKIKPHRK
ncbi:hypothetical protein D3C84_506910 [compost metagenome]